MSYGYKIAPAHLTGTLAGLIGGMQYVIGRGVGSVLGGQLKSNTDLTFEEIFQVIEIVINALNHCNVGLSVDGRCDYRDCSGFLCPLLYYWKEE